MKINVNQKIQALPPGLYNLKKPFAENLRYTGVKSFKSSFKVTRQYVANLNAPNYDVAQIYMVVFFKIRTFLLKRALLDQVKYDLEPNLKSFDPTRSIWSLFRSKQRERNSSAR